MPVWRKCDVLYAILSVMGRHTHERSGVRECEGSHVYRVCVWGQHAPVMVAVVVAVITGDKSSEDRTYAKKGLSASFSSRAVGMWLMASPTTISSPLDIPGGNGGGRDGGGVSVSRGCRTSIGQCSVFSVRMNVPSGPSGESIRLSGVSRV